MLNRLSVRRAPTLAATVAVLVACGSAGGGPAASSSGGPSGPAASSATAAKPNIVFVVTDDMDTASLSYMPKLQAFVSNVGLTFVNSFASNPVCCPSRATMLRGQYSHNHRVWTNGRGNNTCFDDFRAAGHESSTVATWLQTAGYRTGLIGKYLNRYPANRGPLDDGYVPPGWDYWFAIFNGEYNSDSYFSYFANDNKRVQTYGRRAEDYSTDVLAGKAADFVRGNRAAGDKPFFLWIATTAPHADPIPAPRHEGAHADKRAPRTPNFNEDDISDKPRWYRDNLPLLTSRDVTEIDGVYKRRLETLQSVDDLVEKVIQALNDSGAISSTYIFFTSDNGYMPGNHRFPSGKEAPYEESIRVPLIVRGPGVPSGLSVAHDVSNIDLAPTFADLGQAAAPGFIDGRSLVPLLQAAPPAPAAWRQDLLIEHEPVDAGGLPAWAAVRSSREIFVDYPANSEEEYYNMVDDPYQTESRHRSLDPARRSQLKARLGQLQGCAAATCR